MTDLTDVHTEHCCSKHGCKYGITNHYCTVVDGGVAQSYPCEYCHREREEVATWLPEATADELRDEWRSRGMDLDRARHTFDLGPDLPCPSCGQDSLFGYSLRDENDGFQHTHYVCRFWRSGLKPDLSGSLYEHCGWHGWTVRYDDD